MPTVQVAKSHGSEPFDLYYEVHGDGPTKIVLIGGFGNICHQWDLQLDYFKAFPEYSVCIFDNRGAGFSGIPAGRYRTSEMAMDVRDLLDHLGWSRFHIVGLSMGGMIAQELAHLLRHRVVSLTLESTIAYFNGLPTAGYRGMVGGGPKERTVVSLAHHAVNNLLFPKDWLDQPSSDKRFATNRDCMVQFAIDRYAVTGVQDAVGRSNQQIACVTHSMSPARLAQIRNANIPVLVMAGDKDDVLIQPSSSQYLARELGGRFELFEGAGHAIRLQFPDRHNELLKAHIDAAERLQQLRVKDAAAAAAATPRTSRPSVSSASSWWMELEETLREHSGPSRKPIVQVERETVRVVDISFETHTSLTSSSFLAPHSPLSRNSSSVSVSVLQKPEGSAVSDGGDSEEELDQPRRGLLPRLLPALGTLRFGFTDVLSMLPGM
ncbi:Alpha/Beta hydrolase protein [Zopfochytrium polystomum]|nr:Alpha/Beta hydrolase protein [Zopfochytrium polystomum]